MIFEYIKNGKYDTIEETFSMASPLRKSNKQAWAEGRRKADNKNRKSFKEDLCRHVGIEMTDNQKTKFFEEAWRKGHAEGLEQVVCAAEDLAEFLRNFI